MSEGANLFLLGGIEAETIWVVVKWIYVMAFGLYVAFALVIMIQVRQMARVLRGQLDNTIRVVGLAQFVVAVGALVAAIVIL